MRCGHDKRVMARRPRRSRRLQSGYPSGAIPTLEGPVLSNSTDLLQQALQRPPDSPPSRHAARVAADCVIRVRLAPTRLAERFSAIDAASGTPTLLYNLKASSIGVPGPDALRGLVGLSALRHPHLLPIRRVELERDGSIWLLTDYPGSHAGLLTLAQLLSHKTSGTLSEREAFHVVSHLLSALVAAHGAGFAHGSLSAEDALVDPRGRTLIELLGVARELTPSPPRFAEAVRADLRAVAAIVYELLAGVPSNGERLPIPRAIGRAARRWDGWIARTLDEPSGFGDAREALAQLP